MKEKAKIETILKEDEDVNLNIVGSGLDLFILACIIIKDLARIFKIDEQYLIKMISIVTEARNKDKDDISKVVSNILRGL